MKGRIIIGIKGPEKNVMTRATRIKVKVFTLYDVSNGSRHYNAKNQILKLGCIF